MVVRQDEFGRDIESDSDRSSRSRSPPRRRRRRSRSRSNSPLSSRHGYNRRSSRSRSRSPPRRASENRFEQLPDRRAPPPFERKHSYPPSPPHSRPMEDYSQSIPFPPSQPPPRPSNGAAMGGKGGGRVRYQPQVKPPMAGIEPFKSYTEWKSSLNQVDDSSHEAYFAWQSSYVEKLKSVLVGEVCSFEWFSDRYNPISLLKQRSDSITRKASASSSMRCMLLDCLNNQQLEIDTSSIESHPLVTALSLSTFTDNAQQLEQPPPLQGVPGVHNVKDRLVTIRKLPPWCSRGDLTRTLEAAARGIDAIDMDQGLLEETNVEKVYLSDVSKGRGKGYISTAWIVYKDSRVAGGAAPALGHHPITTNPLSSKPLDGMEVIASNSQDDVDDTETRKHRLGAVELYRYRRPRFCPDIFSHPDRIAFDLSAASELASTLDQAAGLEGSDTLKSLLEESCVQQAFSEVARMAEEVKNNLMKKSEVAAAAMEEAVNQSSSSSEATASADNALVSAISELDTAKAALSKATPQEVVEEEDKASSKEEVDSTAIEELTKAVTSAEANVAIKSQEAREAALTASAAATAMLEASLAAEKLQSEALASYDGETASKALQLDVCIAWLRGVHLYAYYGGNKCRDEGDLLDSDDAIYIRPKYKIKKIKDEDEHSRTKPRPKQQSDEVLDIDVRLAMRCAALLEEGQQLEATADFKGASSKYQSMKSLGGHFQDKEMGSQVVEGAEEAISALPTVPLPPSHAPDNAQTASTDIKEKEEVASWAKYEASSSLNFVHDMDLRVKQHRTEALECAAKSQEKNGDRRDDLEFKVDELKSNLSTVKDSWIETQILMVPSKSDPNAHSSKCASCGKVFKEKTFATKHLLSKHDQELEAELWPTLKECMMSAYSRDDAPPLPLLECSDGSSYPITVDPIDILKGKFVQPPPAPTPRQPRGGDRGRDRSDMPLRPQGGGEKRGNGGTQLTTVAYVDVDAPKTSEVKVDYGDALGLLPLPKKKKRKKGKSEAE